MRRYNQDYADTLTLERFYASWNTAENVKPECGEKIFDYLSQPDLYKDVPAIVGSVEGITALRDMGHTIVFATSCTYGMVDQKARWMENYGYCTPARDGRGLPDDFVPIKYKHWLEGDLLIDDGAHNIKPWVEGTRRRAIMLEYPHNANLDLTSMFWSWCTRVPDWPSIVRRVEALSK